MKERNENHKCLERKEKSRVGRASKVKKSVCYVDSLIEVRRGHSYFEEKKRERTSLEFKNYTVCLTGFETNEGS